MLSTLILQLYPTTFGTDINARTASSDMLQVLGTKRHDFSSMSSALHPTLCVLYAAVFIAVRTHFQQNLHV